MKPVAICDNLLSRKRTNEKQTSSYWVEWLTQKGIPFEFVDCYRSDIISILPNYSVLLWHYSNYVNADLMEAQHILDIAESLGLMVFPNHNTGWHFDDKIAEMYALEAVSAPIPQNWVFYSLDSCLEWLKNEAQYPIVAKLRRGSGSNNVKLIKNYSTAKKYTIRMFSRGISPAQSLVYKAYSKIQSTKNWEMFKNRFKQIPNFLRARRFGHGMPIERGYCNFQEFVPNENFDIKVVVVGDKCSFLCRNTRKGDFRASGGGDIQYDHSMISKQIVDSAFAACDRIGMQCVGFDYVVDKRDGSGKIIEMCFGFDFEAILSSGGYFDRNYVWHNEPLNVPSEVLNHIFSDIDLSNQN